MPEDLKDIDARLHALQQFLKQVCAVQPAFVVCVCVSLHNQAKQKSRMGR